MEFVFSENGTGRWVKIVRNMKKYRDILKENLNILGDNVSLSNMTMFTGEILTKENKINVFACNESALNLIEKW